MKRYFLLAILAVGFTACSEGGSSSSKESTNEEEVTTGNAEQKVEEEKEMKAETPDEVTLELYTVGETMQTMQFEPTKLSVPAGAKVTLTLNNKASAEAMIHNAVIIKAGKQDAVIEAGLEAGPDMEYVPEHPAVVAATDLATPGETVEITFTAPEKKGTYQYICTYPGHSAMKGVLLVK